MWHCCLRCLIEVISLASLHGATFGWLMCFSFCVCQVSVCWIFTVQRTLLIETIVVPISLFQWLFVLLWRLHIDGVVYYSPKPCQFRETQVWVCASDLISLFVKWVEQSTHKYIYCICLSSLLGDVFHVSKLDIWLKAHYHHRSKTFVLSWDYCLVIIDINRLAWRLHLSCTYGSNI